MATERTPLMHRAAHVLPGVVLTALSLIAAVCLLLLALAGKAGFPEPQEKLLVVENAELQQLLSNKQALSEIKCKESIRVIVSGTSGTFSDGSDPEDNYDNHLDDCFILEPTALAEAAEKGESARLKLWFPRMKVESEYDFVRVFDFNVKPIVFMGEPSLDEPDVFYSKTGLMVYFHTDYSVGASGWTAMWTIEKATNKKVEEKPEEIIEIE